MDLIATKDASQGTQTHRHALIYPIHDRWFSHTLLKTQLLTKVCRPPQPFLQLFSFTSLNIPSLHTYSYTMPVSPAPVHLGQDRHEDTWARATQGPADDAAAGVHGPSAIPWSHIHQSGLYQEFYHNKINKKLIFPLFVFALNNLKSSLFLRNCKHSRVLFFFFPSCEGKLSAPWAGLPLKKSSPIS